MSLGLKRIETRHWYTRHRGPLAIHAAKRWTFDERDFHAMEHELGNMPATLPLGAIVAIGNLVDIRPTETLLREGLSSAEEGWGNYGPKRFGWVFEDIVALPAPIPFRGAQGLFEIPDHVFAEGYVAPAEPERRAKSPAVPKPAPAQGYLPL